MRKFMIYLLTIASFSTFAKDTRAFTPFDYTPLSFASPQFCAQTLPTAIANVAATAQYVNTMRQQLESYTSISNIKQMFSSYAMGLGMVMFKKLSGKILSNNGIFSYSRLIKDSKNIDMKSQESVQKAFSKMFLQYPSVKEKDKTIYRNIGDQLKMDTAVEMLVTTKGMHDILHGFDEQNGGEVKHTAGMLDTLDAMEACMMEGKDCDKEGMEDYNCEAKVEGEDKMCIWRNALMAANIYNKIMIYNEVLAAMNAQYQAVRAIDLRPKIIEYNPESEDTKSKDKGAFLNLNNKGIGIFNFEENVFASVDVDDNADATEAKENDAYDVLDHVEGFKDPNAGKEKDFESLPLVKEAQDAINEAINAHNVKQNLHGYRKIFTTYENMKLLHNAAINKLKESEKCVEIYLDNYYVNPMKSWNSCGYRDNKIYCHYKTEKNLSDNTVSKGNFDIICPDDREHKCYVTNDLSSRDKVGLYGYLLDLYAEAQKQDAQGQIDAYLIEDEISEDNLENGAMKNVNNQKDRYLSVQDQNNVGIVSSTSLKKMGEQQYGNYKDGNNISALRKPSEQEEVDAEFRKSELLNWTLGSVVAKAVVEDIQTSAAKFGQKKSSYHLWNDQKEFYDQYIFGKYENIKNYINSLPLAKLLAASLYEAKATGGEESSDNGLIAQIKQKSKEISERLVTDDLMLEEDNIWAESDAKLLKMREAYEQSVREIKDKLDGAYKDLDELTDKLDQTQTEYNEANEDIITADETSPQINKGLEYGEELYEDRKDDQKSDVISSQDAQFQYKYKKNNENKVSALAKKADLQAKIDDLKSKIQKKNIEIEDLQQKLASSKRFYVLSYNDALYDARKSMEEKINNENNDNIDVIPEEMIRDIPVLGKAPDIAQCVKDYAIKQVDKALEKIKNLQKDETIYLPHNGEKVQKIHADLINKLTNIKYADLGCDLSALSFDTIILKEAIAKNISKIFTDICSDGYCAPDDDYFVGIKGKKRDMKAPKEAVDFVSAPLREIFHFDEQDYDNVDKYYPDDDELKDNENIIVTDESFLNSGLEIPEIWRYILRRHAFIEKDINFKALFNRGNAKKQYLRSGIYPCLFNNRVIDVTNAQKAKKITTTVNKGFGTGIAVPIVQKYDEYDDTDFIIGDFGYTINKTGDVENYGKLQECQSFIGDGNNITDRQAGGAIVYGKQGEYEEKDVVGTSELGNILSYIPDPRFKVINLFTGAKNKNDRYKLTFNANLQKAIYNVNNFQAVDDDPREKALYYLSERSLLKNNQFGGYLKYVEIEASIAKSLADIENQMEGVKKSLRDVFAGLGYALSDDFDISNENDYNLALSTLNSYKESYMRRALDVIENIQGVTDKIKNDTEKLLHEIDVLMTDRDEFVNITGQEDLDELEEKIKTNKANRAVEEEYNREETEAILNQINQLPSPYCAIYSD